MYTGMLPCLALHGLKLCKSVSRSDLVLISFWMLTMPWIFYPISLFRRASRFVRSRPGKPNQIKGQTEELMSFAPF